MIQVVKRERVYESKDLQGKNIMNTYTEYHVCNPYNSMSDYAIFSTNELATEYLNFKINQNFKNNE